VVENNEEEAKRYGSEYLVLNHVDDNYDDAYEMYYNGCKIDEDSSVLDIYATDSDLEKYITSSELESSYLEKGELEEIELCELHPYKTI
jgi:hypothetical protein